MDVRRIQVWPAGRGWQPGAGHNRDKDHRCDPANPCKSEPFAWHALLETDDPPPDWGDIVHHLVVTEPDGSHWTRRGGTFVWAESGPFIRHFWHNPADEAGFGGQVSSVRTADGFAQFKGPWHLGATAIRQWTGIDTIEVTVYRRGHPYAPRAQTVRADWLAEQVDDKLTHFKVVHGSDMPDVGVGPAIQQMEELTHRDVSRVDLVERVDCPTCDGVGFLDGGPCPHPAPHWNRNEDGTCARCSGKSFHKRGRKSKTCDACDRTGLDLAHYAPELQLTNRLSAEED